MSILQMPDTYYPTPKALADEMVSKLDRNSVHYVLEPSSGMGALCKALARRNRIWTDCRSEIEIDCIEIDPQMRNILRYIFSEEYRDSLISQKRSIEDNRKYNRDRGQYDPLSDLDKSKLENIKEEMENVCALVRIVHDDFLTFKTERQYDAIIMNPPFDHGDLHLLHALDLMKDGGQIVCLLNAETIRNPYTVSRKLLLQKLDEYEAEIEYKTAAFMTSETERKTDVEVAIIRITIPEAEHHSIMFDMLQKAKEQEQKQVDPHELTTAKGSIENLIEQYETEIRLGVALINEYRAIVPYIYDTLDKDYPYKHNILELSVRSNGGTHRGSDINRFAKLVRKKYWQGFFKNPEFTGMLTSNLQKDFSNTVDEMANYEFSEFNIQQVIAQMAAQLTRGVEETIMALFEKLTSEHTWYPECKKNVHYYNGWKTNKAHKVGKRCIIPENGFCSAWYYGSSKELDKSKCYEILSDLEKALSYLDCGETYNYDLKYAIECAVHQGLKKIACKYFDVIFYKKGTCHITFIREDVIDKLNIFAGRRKGWLPPRYGKVRYDDMTDEEQAVIDDFSGKEAYEAVCNEPGRYIIETSSLLRLEA